MNESELLGVEIPVILLWGTKDHSHRVTDHHTIREVVPTAQIIEWDDVGHFPNLEQPGRFFALLEQISGELNEPNL